MKERTAYLNFKTVLFLCLFLPACGEFLNKSSLEIAIFTTPFNSCIKASEPTSPDGKSRNLACQIDRLFHYFVFCSKNSAKVEFSSGIIK